MSSLGNMSDFGDLSGNRTEPASTSDSVRGVNISGYISPGANTNAIDYISIATQGNAVDFGDQVTTSRNGGATSNGHGGL